MALQELQEWVQQYENDEIRSIGQEAAIQAMNYLLKSDALPLS